ncbi:MAG: hypothetical protein PVI52_04045 [Chromatiales bacterium]|jgi:DamX protein
MDNVNEPANQAHPDPEQHSLENKVSRLERQIAEQQDLLRDYEKSLVERIADVDDDRRTTATQLQRAWQSQLEEIDDRLRRQMVMVTGSLVLFLAVVGIVLFLAYHQTDIDRQLLADDLAEIKLELGRTAGQPGDADSIRAELTRLSASVNEISSSLGRQDEKQSNSADSSLEDERRVRDQADSVLDAKIQRLEAKLESLLREREARQEAQGAAEPTKTESAHDLTDAVPAEDTKQDSAQEPAAALVEPPVELTSTSPSAGVSNPEQTAAATQQPFDDDPGKTLAEAKPDMQTPKTLVVSDRTYALQLIGFYGLDTLLSFADRSDLPEQLYYREEVVQGRPWFALIHSLHEDYASAEEQLHQLSPELVAMAPWIRPIPVGVELRVLDMGSQRHP